VSCLARIGFGELADSGLAGLWRNLRGDGREVSQCGLSNHHVRSNPTGMKVSNWCLKHIGRDHTMNPVHGLGDLPIF
jgi:hypothetical protein